MADQTFAVHCGFFDAINSDRTYSADEMNRPYRRVISNGVFATPSGTPSTDLQVVESSGMNIICKAGEGLFADKWFENPSSIVITVPNNTSIVPRIDSVLVQVDTRTSGRVGNIVYRTGTPASSPVPPAINQTEGVKEYRLANIRVNAGVTSIMGRYITDRRGSSDCPWVTSLIYQVDTSTLYDQWQAAYAEYFEQEKAIWDAWYAQLTEDLDVSMTLDRHTNTVTTTPQTTGTIPIGLAYNHNTDILEVYINGLRAIEGTHYVVVDDTSILVENRLQIGQTVTFVVMRSVISGSATNIMVLLQELESQIAGIAGGTPTVVDAKADMTEHDKIYILSSDSKWYYYSTTVSDWLAGGTYGGVPTDTTLSISGSAADAKAVGDALAEKADTDDVDAIDDRVTGVEDSIGDLSQLTTTTKDNLVSAINEAAQTGSGGEVRHELPVLKIYGDISKSNKDAETKAYRYVWENPDDGEQRTGYCSLKWQGESSLTYPKKNYTIKFFHDKKYKRKDKVSLFDELVLKKNKWVIKANWVDRSQAKNVVSCRLWGQMVKSRITEPESHMKAAPNFGAVDGYPVKVYVNDEWHGLYSFNIPKDEDLFGMEEDNPLHCAVCGDDQLSDAVKFRQASTNGWELEVPDAWASYDVEEEGQTVTKYVADGFTSMINFVMTATDEEFKSGLDDYLDVESAIDYYLFAYYACAIDSLGRNLMLVTYDGGNKWYCSLYDADTTWGNGLSGAGTYNPQLACPEMYECPTSLLWERMEACFGDELWERWSDLRQTVFDPDYIKNEFSLFWRYITDDDYQADIDRWTNVDPSRPFMPQWNVDIRKAIPDFIEERVLYCDAQIKAMRTPVPCTGITLDQSSIAFTTGDPITLTATVEPENTTDDIVWTVSDDTILSVEDGVVRPFKNGTATITATCGTQSATCTATVTALSYSVTLTGTHAHLSNTSDVQPNASYTGTLTTDTGYSLTFVSVSMGGIDITETAYNNGVVTIAQVTGNISVAVETVYEYDTTDLAYRLPAEFSVDGSHYIDTLWQYDGVSSFTVALDLTQPDDITTTSKYLLGAATNRNDFEYETSYRGFKNILNNNMQSGASGVSGDRAKIVMRYDSTRHVLSCRSWSRYNSVQHPDTTGETTSRYGHATVTGQASRDAFTQTVYLGAVHKASGAEFSQDSGKIHDCRIYDRRWTDAEVMHWLGVDSLSTVFTDDMDA